MKKTFYPVIVLAVAAAVFAAFLLGVRYGSYDTHYDSFYGASPSFSLDKESYEIGDVVQLSFKLYTENGKTKVRFYENIEHTLKVSLAFRVPYDDTSTVITYAGIDREDIKVRHRGQAKTYLLNKEKPLFFTIEGRLYESSDKVAFVLEFPSLNKRFMINKTNYDEALALEIHGYLLPINPMPGDSLEDYVPPIELVINRPVG